MRFPSHRENLEIMVRSRAGLTLIAEDRFFFRAILIKACAISIRLIPSRQSKTDPKQKSRQLDPPHQGRIDVSNLRRCSLLMTPNLQRLQVWRIEQRFATLILQHSVRLGRNKSQRKRKPWLFGGEPFSKLTFFGRIPILL